MRPTAQGLCVLGLSLMAFWLLERAVPGQWTGYFPDPGTALSLWALWRDLPCVQPYASQA